MGSFNVVCGLSNLAIEVGDEIGYLILSPNELSDDYRDVDYGSDSFSGVDHLFKPFLPPIYGNYADYGDIDGVKKTTTTKVLKEMFGLKPSQVVDCISGQGPYNNSAIFKYFGPKNVNPMDYDKETPEILEGLGFAKNTADENDISYLSEGYSFIYVKDAQSWLVTSEDAEETILFQKYVSKRFPFDTAATQLLNDFSKATGVFPGYKQEDWLAVKTLLSLSGMFFLKDVYDTMLSYEENDSEIAYLISLGVDEDSLKPGQVQKRRYRANYYESLEDDPIDLKILSSHPGKEGFDKDIKVPIEWHRHLLAYREDPDELENADRMHQIIRHCNRVFAPTYRGTQFGDTKASMKLIKVSKSILKTRLTKTESYN